MKCVQVALQITGEQGTVNTTCWVEARKGVKVGSFITLKNHPFDPDAKWAVLRVSAPQEREALHTDWHVGGL